MDTIDQNLDVSEVYFNQDKFKDLCILLDQQKIKEKKQYKDYNRYKFTSSSQADPRIKFRKILSDQLKKGKSRKLMSMWDNKIVKERKHIEDNVNFVAKNCYQTSTLNQKFDHINQMKYPVISHIINQP